LIIEAIKAFLMEYEKLKDSQISVDYLSDSPIEYAVYPIPVAPIIKEYTDGGKLMQYSFAFLSVNDIDQGDSQSILNETWLEEFSDWIEEQNQSRNLPILGCKKTSQKIEIIDSGYLVFYGASNQTAKYQIQCKLTYLKER